MFHLFISERTLAMKVKSRPVFKTITVLILTILMFVSLLPVSSYAGETDTAKEAKTVRLGYFDFEDYMQGAKEGSAKHGLVYELLCDVAAINNWKYEYVYGDFNDL